MDEKINSKHKDDITPLLDTYEDTDYVFLNEKNEATFLCKNCGNGVTRDLSMLLSTQSAIRVRCKCKCGNVFRVLVERRRNQRKIVNFLGMCHYLSDSGQTKKRLIKVLDISPTGLQFSINDMPRLNVGDKVFADFRLDDRNYTEIKVKGAIKRMRSKKVGLEFISIERPKVLTLYLLG
ncbi:PilZ domain-containing protein [uncultured Desulfosarcina sp.]|uniref:PilZ domain-containing protein n=1 Tax=uncultured Desulfosarcina sp. TaxID=218289 RepID=UPI0029C9058D|nr:PilZ domain-containing protein [uncultured Desulfosarcina sp.]